ncbi:hypothetical protein [Salinibacillus xinjiangensis]|uniref:Uncharacterized protein n=1 Tax=Salinibacillus xinjiangensis TaxID=1229268 RepID=A0A6G1X7U0_9BACI|nr:hypothetical protein [Salinibacillus xinjiangensis]MRG86976.1 hypothetical protein [Salinibacillus xinjiangensis]
MTLEQLVKHAQAAKAANDNGISVMWGNEVLVNPQVFLEILEANNLSRTVNPVPGGNVQLKFELGGFKYFTIVNTKTYAQMFEKTA